MGRDLVFDWKIRSHCDRDPIASGRVLISAEFDDRTARQVAGGLKLGKAKVMSPTIDAVDHDIRRSLELIIDTAGSEPPDNWPGLARAVEYIVARPPLPPLVGKAPVDSLDDVVALPKLAKGLLGVVGDHPA